MIRPEDGLRPGHGDFSSSIAGALLRTVPASWGDGNSGHASTRAAAATRTGVTRSEQSVRSRARRPVSVWVLTGRGSDAG